MRFLRDGRGPEFFGKATLTAVFGGIAGLKFLAIRSEFDKWGHNPSVDEYLQITAHMAGLSFLLLVLGTTLFRFSPQQATYGWEPRVSALIGTFLSLSLVGFTPVDLGPIWRTTSISFVLIGWILSTWVLVSLGRSFSITPQSRRLVTTGAYSLVRHPLYVCEEIAFIGVAMMCISPMVVAIVVIQWSFQLRRMTNEERVLRSTFPEYAAYAAQTPKLFPRVQSNPNKVVPFPHHREHSG